jgi:hypothetical protein
VAQSILREGNQDSNKGDKENNALTNALGTTDQQGCVHGVLSKLTSKKGFLQNKSRYCKWKTSSSPMADMEELKRQLRMELLGDLKPIFEYEGIQFPDIPGMMNEV